MSLSATPQRSAYATQQYSITVQNNNIDFDYTPPPYSTSTMKIETTDDNDGLGYPYSHQASSAPVSSNSSFAFSDYNNSPAPQFNTEPLNEWHYMTPTSSRRPSLDDLNNQGLSSSRASNSASPADYDSNYGYSNANNYYMLPYTDHQYSTPAQKAMLDMSMHSSMSSSYQSNYNDSFQEDAPSSMVYHQSSPGVQYQFSQTFVDPSHTVNGPLSTPFHSPMKQQRSPYELRDDSRLEANHTFMPSSPSEAPSPSRSSTKRRRGTTQALGSPNQSYQHDYTSSFSSSYSSSSLASFLSDASQDSELHKVVAERPKFFCNWPSCKKNPNSDLCDAKWDRDSNGDFRSGVGFRRQEHLKRHMQTHTDPKSLPCKFCLEEGKPSKRWVQSRKDNFEVHLKLHTKNADGKLKGTRTSFRPEAVILMDWVQRGKAQEKKQGRNRKRKAEPTDDDEVKAEKNEDDFSSFEDENTMEIVRKYWFADVKTE